MPTSKCNDTGIAIGASLDKFKVIITSSKD